MTAAIDMMDSDEKGLYFLTAKGKGFYDRLKKREFLALTAMKGEDTMSSVAVSIRGKVRELGYDKIPELFEKNPYMRKIYPTEESMQALTVFQIYEGSGEWFDLSKKPIERASFTFGGVEKKAEGYYITGTCIGCGSCAAVCPQNCIMTDHILCYRAGTLLALRELHDGLPCRCGGKKVIRCMRKRYRISDWIIL